MLYVHFLTCCIAMTRFGPHNFLYLSTLSFTLIVVIFVTRPHDTGCLSKRGRLKRRKYSSLFFYTALPYKCCQPSYLLQCNTNLYGSYTEQCSKQQAACCYRLLAADQYIGTDLFICFAVTSRVLPSKEHKINKRTCSVQE
jgi:hypothetical protein